MAKKVYKIQDMLVPDCVIMWNQKHKFWMPNFLEEIQGNIIHFLIIFQVVECKSSVKPLQSHTKKK